MLGGGAFIKGMEHSGCRQTDWGNTWQNSQINKRERERGGQSGRKDRGIFQITVLC